MKQLRANITRKLWGSVALAILVTCVYLLAFGVGTLHAQVTTLSFVVPAGAPIGAGTDLVVFTGRSSGSSGIGDCAAGERPVQTAIVVDPGGSGASRITGVLPTSQTEPVAPGTRLKNLVQNGTCNSGGYDKYTGEVQ